MQSQGLVISGTNLPLAVYSEYLLKTTQSCTAAQPPCSYRLKHSQLVTSLGLLSAIYTLFVEQNSIVFYALFVGQNSRPGFQCEPSLIKKAASAQFFYGECKCLLKQTFRKDVKVSLKQILLKGAVKDQMKGLFYC